MGKKLFNTPEKVVDESLQGFVIANPGLSLISSHRVVHMSKIPQQVALISGGGSGHEPAHIGFIGSGILTAAVCGDIFASPSAKQVIVAIKKVNAGNGVLCIIKNYTGDRLQFGKACERARSDGIESEMVIVGDDCAIPRSKLGAGRRGLCGTLFVHKIAGAASRKGLPLKKVFELASNVSKNVGTVGIALTPCSIPGQKASFTIDDDKMNLGLGIHGESGFLVTGIMTANQAAKACIDLILSKDSDRNYLPMDNSQSIALMINNLGGLTGLETGILIKEAVEYLRSKGFKVARIYSGTLMTSLEMIGASFTIFNLGDGTIAQTILEYLDEPINCVGWPHSVNLNGSYDISETFSNEVEYKSEVQFCELITPTGIIIAKSILKACENLISAEETLTGYDRITGDGDCGLSLSRGAKAILSNLTNEDIKFKSTIPFDEPDKAFRRISEILEDNMGGTSGALLCLFFDSASLKLKGDSVANWVESLNAGVQAIMNYGGGKVGDRTMLDSLVPTMNSITEGVLANIDMNTYLNKCVAAADNGAASTAKMSSARLGRSNYISDGIMTGTPDPGAVAIKIIVTSVVETILIG